jgi:signal transduction histidine kinase
LAPVFAGATLDFATYQTQVLESEEALYRMCQEAVANVLRHSGATVLAIRAQALPSGVVRVEVADNGCGFDVNAAPVDRAYGGYGTRTMCERAEALGGATTVDSTPGQGTRVVIELPRNDR